MEFISICFLSFIFLFFFRLIIFLLRLNFLIYDVVYFYEWEIFSLNSSIIEIVFIFDWIRLMFLSFVLFISSLVIFYRKDYIEGDLNLNRFILLVLLFVFSIVILILSPNLIRILLGWDGLGLVSYCLVIYYQNIKSYNAGILTALSNRLGDVAFLLAIGWILNYGSWNFVFYLELIKLDYEIKIIALFIVFAAITKRAQIPFSSWLPAAIAAPTPVSALVHSSTLVTAGVYLLIRFNFLFIDTYLRRVLLLISGLTIFIAGLGANFEFDLKKIIALSTLSQLGLIIRILSLGFFKLAFFHLLTHALFKALLFICAGVIIHNIKNSQDIRDIGGLVFHIPITLACLNIANLSLCGLPFLSGFYSKDMILEIVLISQVNFFSFFLFFFSTGLTVSYSIRLFYYSFLKFINQSSFNALNDSSFVIQKSIVCLMIFAVVGGSIINWLIFPFLPLICLSFFFKMFTLLVCLLGGFIGFFLSRFSFCFERNKSLNYYFFSYYSRVIWFLPFFSTIGVSFTPLNFSFQIFKNLDQGWIEFFGVHYLFSYFIKNSQISQVLQLNNIKIYLTLFVFWLTFLFILVLCL